MVGDKEKKVIVRVVYRQMYTTTGRFRNQSRVEEEIGIEKVLEAQLHTEAAEGEIALETVIGKMKPTTRNLVDTK